jgi:anti-sigma factor RsiW
MKCLEDIYIISRASISQEFLMEDIEEQRLIKEYLLGTLTEEEQQQIEQRVFTNPQFKARVLMGEDELVEDYVAGLLSESERERFTKHFLSTPSQIQKLRVTRALHTYAGGDTTANATLPVSKSYPVPLRKSRLMALIGERQAVAVLSVAAVLIIVIGAVIYFAVWRGETNQRAAIEQEVAQLNNRQDPGTGLPSGVDPVHAGVLPVRLSPTLNRASGEMARIVVPVEAKIVQMRFPLTPEPYRSYQATLSTIEGNEIFTLASLQPIIVDGNRTLMLNIPARVLVHGDYLLKLRGVTETGNLADAVEYPFRIAR